MDETAIETPEAATDTERAATRRYQASGKPPAKSDLEIILDDPFLKSGPRMTLTSLWRQAKPAECLHDQHQVDGGTNGSRPAHGRTPLQEASQSGANTPSRVGRRFGRRDALCLAPHPCQAETHPGPTETVSL